MLDYEKAANLLGLGIQQNIVAKSLGVSPSTLNEAIHQDSKLQELIQQKKEIEQAKEIRKVVSLGSIESSLLTKIGALVNEVEGLGEATMALSRIMDMRSKLRGNAAEDTGGIRLTLPPNFRGQVNISAATNGDIYEINGRSMETMPGSKVREWLQMESEQASL